MRSIRKSGLNAFSALLACAVTVVTAVSGCNTSGCLDNRNALPLAGFYSSATGKTISVDSVEIGGVGAPNDTLLATARYAISQTYLPFRATRDTTSFYIRYVSHVLNRPELYDTLTFAYTSHPELMSEECGVSYVYHITGLEHTFHLIDSVTVTDSIVNNLDMERIHIYFRTSNP